jgi:cytochrome c2
MPTFLTNSKYRRFLLFIIALPAIAVFVSACNKHKSAQTNNKTAKQSTSARKANLSPDALQGYKIAKRDGCLNCHTTNGKSKTGPTLKNLYGSQVTLKDGSTVTADSSYIVQSLNHPNAKITAGFAPIMTNYDFLTSSQVKYLMAYLKSLSDVND